MHDITVEIQTAVRQLKSECDTWRAVALQYKDAFEAQTKRFNELQDVCFATQAELENERAQHEREKITQEENLTKLSNTDSSLRHSSDPGTFGLATVFLQPDIARTRRTSGECNDPLFARVHDSIAQRNYGTALSEVENLLRGPLSPKARAEGLLLKSSVLKAAGPEELYDALAACSEALELCGRLSELEAFLPRVQYQRGVLYYQLRMLHHARDAFGSISDNDPLSIAANDHRRSCDEELELQQVANRRSGFDEHRTVTEGLLAQLDGKSLDYKRRRTSAQFRLRAAAKAKRMSLPHRWSSHPFTSERVLRTANTSLQPPSKMSRSSDTSQATQTGRQPQHENEQPRNPHRTRYESNPTSPLSSTTLFGSTWEAPSKSRFSSTQVERTFGPGNASEAAVIKRGKDWDSEFRPINEKVSSPLLNGSSSSVFEHMKVFEESSAHPQPVFNHRRYKSEALSMNAILSRNDAQSQNRPPKLQLSKILTIQLPATPTSTTEVPSPIPESPISLGPCSSTDSHLNPPYSPEPASPDHALLPKYMTAFEYAMDPYLQRHFSLQHFTNFPLSPQSTPSTPISPPFVPPRHKSEISFSSTSSTPEVANSGLPAHLAHLNTWAKRIALARVRTLLMRCSVLQTSIHRMHHMPDHVPKDKPIHWHYSKMRYLAYKAYASVEMLQSNDWTARCEYWLGRACAGTKDWEAARKCFQQARDLDVEDEKDEEGNLVVARGLKRAEKEDVEKLFKIAAKNEKIWKREVDKVRRAAEEGRGDDWEADVRVLADWSQMEDVGAVEWDRE